MRVVLSAIIFVFLGAGIYFLVVKMPVIRQYRDCYNTAYLVVNEEHIITRQAWTTEQNLCKQRKQTLLKAAQCFNETDASQQVSQKEMDIMKTAARTMARGTQTLGDLIAEHNKRCMYPTTVMQLDTRTNTWF